VTHEELVKRAAAWLRRQHGVVITEMAAMDAPEEPDAIGFCGGTTTLIECKASVADFRADFKKACRQLPDLCMGAYRYYATPKGLLGVGNLPIGWGLLEPHAKGLAVRLASRAFHKRNIHGELGLLISALRRIGRCANQFEGVSVKAYTYKTMSRATLGVLAEPPDPMAGMRRARPERPPFLPGSSVLCGLRPLGGLCAKKKGRQP